MIIVHQCYKAIEAGSTTVKIISNDTDVFALACHFFPKERDDTTVFMEPTKSSRTVTDIGATVEKHGAIIDSVLAAHALSGCDTVCHYLGIGKKTVIKTLYQQPPSNYRSFPAKRISCSHARTNLGGKSST